MGRIEREGTADSDQGVEGRGEGWVTVMKAKCIMDVMYRMFK